MKRNRRTRTHAVLRSMKAIELLNHDMQQNEWIIILHKWGGENTVSLSGRGAHVALNFSTQQPELTKVTKAYSIHVYT